MQKNIKTKLLISLLVATLLSVGFLGYYLGARAGYIADESEPWLTQPLQEASYIIGVYNSTHYYARNSTGYGTVANLGYEMLGTSADNILEWAEGNLTSGGEIFITAGNYMNINWVITQDELTVSGEGRSTKLFQSTNTLDVIQLAGTEANPVEDVVIRDLYLEGAGAPAGSQCGIWMNNTKNCLIENNYVMNMSSNEGAPYHTSAIQLWYYNYNNTITKNWVERGTWIGISCAGGSQYNIISENHVQYTVDNCIDFNGDAGYETWYNQAIHNTLINSTNREGIDCDDADYNLFQGNMIVSVTTNAITIGGSVSAYGNEVSDNLVFGNGVTGIGIVCDNVAHNTMVANNKVYDCTQVGIEFDSTLNCSAVSNEVYCCVYGIWVHDWANHTMLIGNRVFGDGNRGYQIEEAMYTQITGGYICDETYGIYMKSANYTSIVGVFIYNSLDRPIIESTSGLTCDWNLLDGCMLIKYVSAKTWGVAGNNVTGDNLEVASP